MGEAHIMEDRAKFQSRRNIAALERDLYHGQYCYDNDFQFRFEDSDQYLGDPGPSIMTEMEPRVTFTSSLRELPQHTKLNTNRYATKKTIAQGMLDIALLSTNASQLKYVLQVGEEHEYYTPMLVLITSSIVLQVLNGLTQVLMGPLNLDKEEFKPFLNIVNYISMFLSYGIVGIDAIKAIFFPQTIFSTKK